MAIMCRANRTSSESAAEGVRGGRPDFESSPDVLTCRKTLREEVRSTGIALLSAVAALLDVRVSIAYRLGIAEHRAYSARRSRGKPFRDVHARIFDLFDCSVPMKCHLIS